MSNRDELHFDSDSDIDLNSSDEEVTRDQSKLRKLHTLIQTSPFEQKIFPDPNLPQTDNTTNMTTSINKKHDFLMPTSPPPSIRLNNNNPRRINDDNNTQTSPHNTKSTTTDLRGDENDDENDDDHQDNKTLPSSLQLERLDDDASGQDFGLLEEITPARLIMLLVQFACCLYVFYRMATSTPPEDINHIPRLTKFTKQSPRMFTPDVATGTYDVLSSQINEQNDDRNKKNKKNPSTTTTQQQQQSKSLIPSSNTIQKFTQTEEIDGWEQFTPFIRDSLMFWEQQHNDYYTKKSLIFHKAILTPSSATVPKVFVQTDLTPYFKYFVDLERENHNISQLEHKLSQLEHKLNELNANIQLELDGTVPLELDGTVPPQLEHKLPELNDAEHYQQLEHKLPELDETRQQQLPKGNPHAKTIVPITSTVPTTTTAAAAATTTTTTTTTTKTKKEKSTHATSKQKSEQPKYKQFDPYTSIERANIKYTPMDNTFNVDYSPMMTISSTNPLDFATFNHIPDDHKPRMINALVKRQQSHILAPLERLFATIATNTTVNSDIPNLFSPFNIYEIISPAFDNSTTTHDTTQEPNNSSSTDVIIPPKLKTLLPTPTSSLTSQTHTTTSHDADTLTHRRNFVRQMIKHSYTPYRTKCLSFDHITPVTGRCVNIFGNSLTLFDSLSTLYIVGAHDDVNASVQHLLNHLDISTAFDRYSSTFELGIRYLGGLTSYIELSGDLRLVPLLTEFSEKLVLSAFPRLNVRIINAYKNGYAKFLAENPEFIYKPHSKPTTTKNGINFDTQSNYSDNIHINSPQNRGKFQQSRHYPIPEYRIPSTFDPSELVTAFISQIEQKVNDKMAKLNFSTSKTTTPLGKNKHHEQDRNKSSSSKGSTTWLPFPHVSLNKAHGKFDGWAKEFILAEVASFQAELLAVSDILANPVFYELGDAIVKHISMNYLVQSIQPDNVYVSMGKPTTPLVPVASSSSSMGTTLSENELPKNDQYSSIQQEAIKKTLTQTNQKTPPPLVIPTRLNDDIATTYSDYIRNLHNKYDKSTTPIKDIVIDLLDLESQKVQAQIGNILNTEDNQHVPVRTQENHRVGDQFNQHAQTSSSFTPILPQFNFPIFYQATSPHIINTSSDMTFGGLGDSFFEVLLKQWIVMGKNNTNLQNLYLDSIRGLQLYNYFEVNGIGMVGSFKTDKLDLYLPSLYQQKLHEKGLEELTKNENASHEIATQKSSPIEIIESTPSSTVKDLAPVLTDEEKGVAPITDIVTIDLDDQVDGIVPLTHPGTDVDFADLMELTSGMELTPDVVLDMIEGDVALENLLLLNPQNNDNNDNSKIIVIDPEKLQSPNNNNNTNVNGGDDDETKKVFKLLQTMLQNQIDKNSKKNKNNTAKLPSGNPQPTQHSTLNLSTEHLNCFAGGMLGLGVHYDVIPTFTEKQKHLYLAEQLTLSCSLSYLTSFHNQTASSEAWSFLTMDLNYTAPRPTRDTTQYVNLFESNTNTNNNYHFWTHERGGNNINGKVYSNNDINKNDENNNDKNSHSRKNNINQKENQLFDDDGLPLFSPSKLLSYHINADHNNQGVESQFRLRRHYDKRLQPKKEQTELTSVDNASTSSTSKTKIKMITTTKNGKTKTIPVHLPTTATTLVNNGASINESLLPTKPYENRDNDELIFEDQSQLDQRFSHLDHYSTNIAHLRSFIRPETVESLYVLYSTTKSPIYRDIAWFIAQSLHIISSSQYGYSSIITQTVNHAYVDKELLAEFNKYYHHGNKYEQCQSLSDNVKNNDDTCKYDYYDPQSPLGFYKYRPAFLLESILLLKDRQDSWVMAETLKYLYLIFEDDDNHTSGGNITKKNTHIGTIGHKSTPLLDNFVFTTEAHVLRQRPHLPFIFP